MEELLANLGSRASWASHAFAVIWSLLEVRTHRRHLCKHHVLGQCSSSDPQIVLNVSKMFQTLFKMAVCYESWGTNMMWYSAINVIILYNYIIIVVWFQSCLPGFPMSPWSSAWPPSPGSEIALGRGDAGSGPCVPWIASATCRWSLL